MLPRKDVSSWEIMDRRNKTPAQLDREITKALRLEPPRIRHLGFVTGLPVYLVSGEQVRNQIDIDFTQGGNEAAYPGYVPAGEIWIDDAMHSLDRIATIFHEVVERNLVLYGGMDYDDAHEIACEREVAWRKKLALKRPTSTDLRLVTAALRPYREEAKASGKRPGKPSRTIGSTASSTNKSCAASMPRESTRR